MTEAEVALLIAALDRYGLRVEKITNTRHNTGKGPWLCLFEMIQHFNKATGQ